MLKMDYLMLMFGKEQQRNDPRSVKDLLNCFLFFFFQPYVKFLFLSSVMSSNLFLKPITLELLKH